MDFPLQNPFPIVFSARQHNAIIRKFFKPLTAVSRPAAFHFIG